MKRFFTALSALIMALFLGGCDSVMNVEGVLSPPSLTAQQNNIYEALKKQVGPDIQLCYPQNGEYRSAFIIKNIDDEPTEEAIVFYKSGLEATRSSNLRINVLDQQEDGSWISACDIAGSGFEVDRVEFGVFGTGNRINIVVGYKRDAAQKKIFTIYQYEAGMLKGKNEFEYDIFSLLKLPGSNESRLVFVGDVGPDRKKAMLVSQNSGGFQVNDSIPLYSEVYSYCSVTSGNVTTSRPALFLEGYTYAGLCTQILTLEDGKLTNITYRANVNLTAQTLRAQEMFCSDINGDGIIEIPRTVLMPGNQELDPDAMYYTDWLAYVGNNFTVKETTFINTFDGYQLSVPRNWKTAVSAERITEQDEVAFYLYETSGKKGDELLRIRAVQKTEAEQNVLKQGFFKLASVGQITYMAKINIDANSEYRLVKDELFKRFSTIL